MSISRSTLLKTFAASIALQGCSRSLSAKSSSLSKSEPPSEEKVGAKTTNSYAAKSSTYAPPAEYIILNKLAYGSSQRDLQHIKEVGISKYLEEQLNPNPDDDKDCDERIASAKLHIEHGAGGEGKTKWKAVNEDRSLSLQNKDSKELWKLVSGEDRDWSEKTRPAEEIRVTTMLRAVYSNWQLREVMVQFWHNHFNVSISKDEKIAAMLPVYDRDVIRKNCFGNFRQFLEDVATSACMGYYLDNAASKASPANENFARELFELHTLGAENYLNSLYNRWREVPGATNGLAVGYIDQDIYEAARAFTGWTIADGSDNGSDETFPNNGSFYYFEGWHDNYQKRVLGVEFEPNQGPMHDGKRVLDIVAYHPATANRICKKICQRLVGDTPSESLVKRASDTWIAENKAPDQIKKVLHVIINSPELQQSFGAKFRNPFELVMAFLRSTDANFKPNNDFLWALSQTGYALFEYRAPTGHPDVAEHWLGTNMMLQRWNIISKLMSDWMKTADFELAKQHPQEAKTSQQIVSFWMLRMFGRELADHKEAVSKFLAQDAPADSAPQGNDEEDDLTQRLNSMVALLAMLPEYQLR